MRGNRGSRGAKWAKSEPGNSPERKIAARGAAVSDRSNGFQSVPFSSRNRAAVGLSEVPQNFSRALPPLRWTVAFTASLFFFLFKTATINASMLFRNGSFGIGNGMDRMERHQYKSAYFISKKFFCLNERGWLIICLTFFQLLSVQRKPFSWLIETNDTIDTNDSSR